jgi:peptide/nickel transport system permease protein
MRNLRGVHLAAGFFAMLLLVSLFADFLSSNPPAMQDLDMFYHPPERIHFFDQQGRFQKPFIYKTELRDPLDASYKENTAEAYPLEFFFKGYRYTILGLFSSDRHLIGRSRHPRYYPLGSDDLGRDVLARVLAGTRTSLLVVGLGIILYSAIGLVVGVFAGLFGGWVDSLLMRFSEFVLALPALYLVLALRSILPMRTPFLQTLIWVTGAIAAVAWPPMARGVRGLILQVRNSAYVEAARSLGGTRAHIFLRHMLPSLMPFVLAQLAVAAPVFLLGEIILSFLNVGFQDAGESWGSMLRSLKDTRVITDFWWNLMPLCMVFLTLLSLNVLSSCGRKRIPEDQVMRI